MHKVGSAVVAVLLISLAPAPAVAATRQPSVTGVRVPDTARVGQSFTAEVVVVNKLRRRTDAARVKVVLSRDKAVDSADVRVATVDVPRLKPGARRTYDVDVVSRRAGARYVIACIRSRCRAGSVLVTKPGQDPALPPPAGNPLDVTPVLDTAHAASALVTAETGGTITATGADGSVFVLEVPPDGVLTDEEITLTPVASLDGKPFAGPASAVDITPHGLQLTQLATLTITPPAAIPLSRQLVFATRQSGKDFHAYPPTQDASQVQLQLSHFSVGGVGSATSTEREAVAGRTPDDAQAQLEKLIGEQVQEMKRQGSFDGDLLVPHLLDYYQHVVRPRLVGATHDDSLAALALASFLGWLREAHVVVVDDLVHTQITEGLALVDQVAQYAFDQGFERCMNKETAYAAALMALARLITILGGPESVGDQARERLEKCARFELDLDVRVYEYTRDDKTTGHITEIHDLSAQAHDIELLTSFNNKGRLETTGTQPLVVTDWFYSNSAAFADDWHAGNTEALSPVVVEADIPLAYRIETASDGRTRFVLKRGRARVDLDPGRINTFYTKGDADYQYPTIFTYYSAFRGVWGPEQLTERPGIFRFGAFFDETLPKLGLFLEERDTHREFDQFITDRTSRLRMELEHAPQR